MSRRHVRLSATLNAHPALGLARLDLELFEQLLGVRVGEEDARAYAGAADTSLLASRRSSLRTDMPTRAANCLRFMVICPGMAFAPFRRWWRRARARAEDSPRGRSRRMSRAPLPQGRKTLTASPSGRRLTATVARRAFRRRPRAGLLSPPSAFAPPRDPRRRA